MPSTTSIRLAFALALLSGAEAAGAAGAAQCYARVYTDQHLAQHPSQVVRSIRILVPEDARTEGVRLSATFSDQGHVAGTGMEGRTLTQGLFCISDRGPLRCGIDCDGGTMTLHFRHDGALEIVSDFLQIGAGDFCGGGVNLVEEPGLRVIYRLLPAEPARCEGL